MVSSETEGPGLRWAPDLDLWQEGVRQGMRGSGFRYGRGLVFFQERARSRQFLQEKKLMGKGEKKGEASKVPRWLSIGSEEWEGETRAAGAGR